MEYCALDLDFYIYYTRTESVDRELPKFLTENVAPRRKMWQIWDITQDILNGLFFIHSHALVHRDIKPRNSKIPFDTCLIATVLYSSQSDSWKIADFGLTVEGTSRRERPTQYGRGTEGYRAPELLLVQHENPTFTNKVDIWATGCVIYETIFRRRTFASDMETMARAFQWSQSDGTGIELPETVDCIPNRQYWTVLSDMIHVMLEVRVAMRPTAEDLLEMLGPRGTQSAPTSISTSDPQVVDTDNENPILLSLASRGTNNPNTGPALEVESEFRKGLVTYARKNFKDRDYEAVIEALKKEYAELNGSFRAHFENWEELYRMLIISQCKMGYLTAAKASVLRALNERRDLNGVGGEDPIFKLAKPLILRYSETNMLKDAGGILTEFIEFRKRRSMSFIEPQCAFAELCLMKQDIDTAKKLCEEIKSQASLISRKLRDEL